MTSAERQGRYRQRRAEVKRSESAAAADTLETELRRVQAELRTLQLVSQERRHHIGVAEHWLGNLGRLAIRLTQLSERLPDAEREECLDIRRQLQEDHKRFRSALALAERPKSAR